MLKNYLLVFGKKSIDGVNSIMKYLNLLRFSLYSIVYTIGRRVDFSERIIPLYHYIPTIQDTRHTIAITVL